MQTSLHAFCGGAVGAQHESILAADWFGGMLRIWGVVTSPEVYIYITPILGASKNVGE